MKKRLFLFFLALCGLFFVGCARTKTTDVFRFEVRELQLTLQSNTENIKEKELKLIRGDTDKNATIVYTVSYIDGANAGTIDMNNGIIEVRGSGTNDKGYVTTKGIDDVVKIVPLSEGVVRFSAYVDGKENISDSINVKVTKEVMSGFRLSAIYSDIYVGTTTGFRTSALPSYLDASVLKYELSDEKIATISDSGILKGLVPGTVTVKAYSKYDPSMYATTTVKVSYAAAGSIIMYDEDINEVEDDIVLTNGETFTFTTDVHPSDATLSMDSVSQKVTYKSSDSKVFSVTTNEDGSVSIITNGGGEATLTIESDDKKVKLETVVIVNWPQTATFNLKKEELDVAVKKNVVVERDGVDPEKANPNFVVEYKDEADKEFISINGTKIEGLKPGTAYVVVKTIESGTNIPLEKEVKVNVSYDTLKEINLTIKGLSITTGDSKFVDGVYNNEIKWSLNPSGSNPAVKLSSSDETIAKVDAEGKLTIYDKVGTAIITIESEADSSIKAEYVVKVTSKPTSFTVDAPEEDTVFVYSDTLTVVLTVHILPEDAPQDAYDVEIDNTGSCYVDYETEGNEITLIFDPDGLGKFDVIITVDGISGEWIHSYEVAAPAQ